jgi:hypothetical protein
MIHKQKAPREENGEQNKLTDPQKMSHKIRQRLDKGFRGVRFKVCLNEIKGTKAKYKEDKDDV